MHTSHVLEDLKSKTKVIVKRAVKGAAAATFAASLVPLGSVGPVGADEAKAVNATHIDSTVVFNNVTNKWDYTFQVFNDSDGINEYGVNWELPLFNTTNFNDSIISDVILPDDWSVELLVGSTSQSAATTAYGGYDWDSGYDSTTDPFSINGDYDGSLFEDPDFVIHFFSDFEVIEDEVLIFEPINPIDPFGTSHTFGFSSDYGPTNAPYLMSFFNQPPRSGDPPTPSFGVNSPGAPTFQVGGVPEPITGTLAAISGFALVGYTRRRRG